MNGTLSVLGSEEFQLRLTGAEQTIFVSERPNRIFGSTPTATFVAGDFPNFQGDAPNAVLQSTSPQQATVLELLAASLEGTEVVYRCRALPGRPGRRFVGDLVTPQDFPSSFGASTLLIDNASQRGKRTDASFPHHRCLTPC